jgi:hypothetical protein
MLTASRTVPVSTACTRSHAAARLVVVIVTVPASSATHATTGACPTTWGASEHFFHRVWTRCLLGVLHVLVAEYLRKWICFISRGNDTLASGSDQYGPERRQAKRSRKTSHHGV